MKFFVPRIKDDADAECVFRRAKALAQKHLGWEVSDRRIQKIRYVHDEVDDVAEVGQIDKSTGEPVLIILESHVYLVCTSNHGVVRNIPMLVGKEEAYEVVYFDDASTLAVR